MPLPIFEKMGEDWGIREEQGNPAIKDQEGYAWTDESDYYYIKVTNEPELDSDFQRRTLVLDNLIHGYFVLGHPERLDYDYEHIYALVAYRAAKGAGKITVAPDSPSTIRPQKGKVAGRDLPEAVFASQEAPGPKPAADDAKGDANQAKGKPGAPENPKPSSEAKEKGKDNDREKNKDKDKDDDDDEARPSPSLPKVTDSTLKTLFLGGGAYTFQRHMQYAYPGTAVDVAEIDPAVTNANHMATGLPIETTIHTEFGDARQFVERHQGQKQYDLIFGDAFNDFSVPWHLTTREFNEKIANLMSPTGVYMINIIDVYESDAIAIAKANKKIETQKVTDPAGQEAIRNRELARARNYGGFLGAWARTAKLTFPYIYIFGTDRSPGGGLRETFVVVASRQPLDLKGLAKRDDDPQFYHRGRRTEPVFYGAEDEKVIFESRSRGITLTDDYAPVENLLAPVAKTRGDE
jgi:hypothetical protein